MSTGLWILIVIIGIILGGIGGFFIARRYMINYFQDNPPIDETMIRTMMAQMGQKPSERKVKQIIANMKNQSAAARKKK